MLFKIVIINIILGVTVVCISGVTHNGKPIIKVTKERIKFMIAWIILSILSVSVFSILCIWRL